MNATLTKRTPGLLGRFVDLDPLGSLREEMESLITRFWREWLGGARAGTGSNRS